MTPERWQQVSAALDKALHLPTTERPDYFAQLARSDPELHREVESLLASHQEAGAKFLESYVVAAALGEDDADRRQKLAGRRVGAYQIVEQIGVGGMGEVYRAVRADDQYRKQVALKVVRGGQDSAFVISRFKNERQILASLDHPNIARLLDGGSTEDGAPYFVMELIEGEPIERYCDHHGLSLGGRLRLFLEVCSAVQFAHQRLIIHRDLKPGNILVTADGATKLLDFGIAKILESGALTDSFEPTLTEFRALTPSYASPEQIKGEPITTASDVYSLGVILYELLTRQHPYRAPGDTVEKVARSACEVEPKKPSNAVRTGHTREPDAPGSVLTDRETEKLRKGLRGDLDNIILMALRKEPQRRYGSVELFAQDIRRHLENLPVSARNDTIVYRISKFARRHRAGIVATCIVIVALALGVAMALQQKRRADRRFNDVRKLANSLLFEIHDSIRDLPGSTPARKLLVDRALQYLDSLSAESGNDLSLMRELATAYERVGEVQGQYLQSSLGDTAGALRSYQKALSIRQQVAAKSGDGQDRLRLAACYRLVAIQLWASGGLRDAVDNIEKAIALSEALRSDRPDDEQVLAELASEYEAAAQIHGASHGGGLDDGLEQENNRRAAAIDEALLKIKPDDEKIQRAYELDLVHLGGLDNYRKCLEVAQSLLQRNATTQHLRDVGVCYNHIGTAYDSMGDSRESLANFQKALEIYQQLIAADPRNTMLQQGLAIAYINVGLQMGEQGDKSQSLSLLAKSLDIMKSLAASDPQNIQHQAFLAEFYTESGNNRLRLAEPEAAGQDYETACSIWDRLHSVDTKSSADVKGASCRSKVGYAALRARHEDRAAALFHQALDLLEPFLSRAKLQTDALQAAADSYAGLGDIEVQRASNRLRAAVSRSEHWRQAQVWYRNSLAIWERVPEKDKKRPGNPDGEDPETVTKNLRRCEAALAQGSSTGPL
ncbi:MAG: serine/threonine-protein kinase [Silvibacterium sp.]